MKILLLWFYCNFRGIFYQLHIKMINRDVLKLLYAIVRLLCKGCKPEISEIGTLSQVLLSKPLQADCIPGIIFLSKAFSLYFYRDTIYLGRCPKLGYPSLSGLLQILIEEYPDEIIANFPFSDMYTFYSYHQISNI